MNRIPVVALAGAIAGVSCSPADSSLEARLAALESNASDLRDENEALEARNTELQGELERAAEMMANAEGVNVTEIPLDEALARMPEDIANSLGLDGLSSSVRMRPTSTSNASSEALRYTAWVAGDLEQGAWYSVQFGETLVSWASNDLDMVTAVADFSGMHAACLGQPLCVVALTHDGQVVVQHYDVNEIGNVIRPMQCVDWTRVGEGSEVPTADEFRQNGGMEVVRSEGSVVCLRDVNGLELSLYSGRPGETGPLPVDEDAPPPMIQPQRPAAGAMMPPGP